MKIVVTGTRGFPGVQGGVERHCQELYPRLSALGCEITVFGRKGYIPDAETAYNGVKIVPVWTPRKKSLEAIIHTFFCVLKAALSNRYDLIHIHAIGPSLLVPFARLLGLKVVVTNHGPDYDRQKWGRFAKAMLRLGEKLGAKYGSEVIAVSRHIQELLKKKYNRDSVYIPNGVDLTEKLSAGNVLKKYGLDAGKYIFAVGRFVPEKGFHDLIGAFLRLSTDWKLVIAGDADHEDNYSRNLKDSAAKDPRVVMTGFIKGDTLRELYSNAGLFVLPSYHEGLPIVALEAMSYGLPLLMSSIPAHSGFASPEEMFKAGDIEELADKLELFIKRSSSLPLKDDKFKRERLETEFNWDRIAEQTLEVYKRLLGRNHESFNNQKVQRHC
ncbi:MAG: glycosyltransferase family 4 protein [Nitrospirae bacterium]|nr:glycosyltransferase family 4 protein [Nitrospirota bacterium]